MEHREIKINEVILLLSVLINNKFSEFQKTNIFKVKKEVEEVQVEEEGKSLKFDLKRCGSSQMNTSLERCEIEEKRGNSDHKRL